MKINNNDGKLELLIDSESGEYYKGCTICKTDSYLMDLEDSKEIVSGSVIFITRKMNCF